MPTSVELRSGLTKAEIEKILSYDPETGIFTRRIQRSRYFAGERAGRIHHSGYETLKIEGYYFTAHRVAWLLMTGEWPQDDIDHMDRNRTNNRWSNLRAATREQNSRNSIPKKNNSTGIVGVSEFRGKFIAHISTGGSRVTNKTFRTLKEAVAWRKEMELLHYKEFSPAQTDRLVAQRLAAQPAA